MKNKVRLEFLLKWEETHSTKNPIILVKMWDMSQ